MDHYDRQIDRLRHQLDSQLDRLHDRYARPGAVPDPPPPPVDRAGAQRQSSTLKEALHVLLHGRPAQAAAAGSVSAPFAPHLVDSQHGRADAEPLLGHADPPAPGRGDGPVR